MKKIVLFIIFGLLLLPRVCLAATVNYIDNIDDAPRIKNKRTIYITNMSNYDIKINDTSNFYNDAKNVYIRENAKSTSYNKPVEFTFKNAGYYINDNGDKVDVNVKVSFDLVQIYNPNNKKRTKLNIASFGSDHFWVNAPGGDLLGTHIKMSLNVTKNNGVALDSNIANNMMIPWYLSDIDIADYTNTNQYRESIKFSSGFYDQFYVSKGTYLEITDNNTRYTRTKQTTGAAEEKKSTVVSYQTSPQSVIEYWGSGCGTRIQMRTSSFDYPYLKKPSLTADQKKYRTGDTVTLTMKQKFPYTITSNTAKSIVVSNTFDNALDISNLKFKVLSGSNDVSSSWTKKVNGQDLTLTYKKTNFISVVGEYTFILSNIKIKHPDKTHRIVRSSEIR